MVVSPRSYFVFTPLLASTAVGTLEFRTTLESVRARRSGVEFVQGWADDVSFNEKRLTIEESISDPKSHSLTGKEGEGEEKKKGKLFDLSYDKLVVAVGCYSQTFNTPGVRENALFLKDVVDARKIRKRLLECKSSQIIHHNLFHFTLPVTSAAELALRGIIHLLGLVSTTLHI